MVQVSRTASLCSRTYQPKHRSGMSDLVTLSCWGAVLSGLGKFHWPNLDLVPGSVGVVYGDRRPQWAWSRSAVKQSRSRTVLWPITQYPGFYTTSRAWWMIQLISGKKDWKHVPVQKVITSKICCNVACLTFHLPHTTTSSFQSHQCQPTTGSFQIHERSEKRTYRQSDENVVYFTR